MGAELDAMMEQKLLLENANIFAWGVNHSSS
jgi:hypothetical protein